MLALFGAGCDRVDEHPLLLIARGVRFQLGVQYLPFCGELLRLSRRFCGALCCLSHLVRQSCHSRNLDRLAVELQVVSMQHAVHHARLSRCIARLLKLCLVGGRRQSQPIQSRLKMSLPCLRHCLAPPRFTFRAPRL